MSCSQKSSLLHRFCQRFLSFLLIQCPLGNLHYRWNKVCHCGIGIVTGAHHSDRYQYVGHGWWHRIGSDVAVRTAENPHAYLCVEHGGSTACQAKNIQNGFQCPRCIAELTQRSSSLNRFAAHNAEAARELRRIAEMLDAAGSPAPQPSPPTGEHTVLRW